MTFANIAFVVGGAIACAGFIIWLFTHDSSATQISVAGTFIPALAAWARAGGIEEDEEGNG